MTEEELRKENEELKKTVEALTKQNAQLRNQLFQQSQEAARRYRLEYDYLPYEDDDRR